MSKPKRFLNYIANQWVDSEQLLDIENPATEQTIAQMAIADEAMVDAAVGAARKCVESRALIDCRPVERARILYEIGKEILTIADKGAELLAKENGKSVSDCRDEFIEAARYFEYYAGLTDKIEGKSIPLGKDYIDFTLMEPYGVSAQIVPWNFPVSIAARSIAPALATGNAVVVKSPELCPLALSELAKAFERSALPPGAVNIICGLGSVAGQALTAHRDIDQIVFTGSVNTGIQVMKAAAQRALPTVMELGGKSAAVVFDDANIDNFLSSLKSGIFFNSGQVCSALSRVLVQDTIYEQTIEAINALATNQNIGANADITPLASRSQMQGVLSLCERSKSNSRLVCGGQRAQGLTGYFVEPTVFADVDSSAAIFQTEVFGPVVSISPFSCEEDAWRLANSTQFGLVAGVFTQNLGRAMRAAQKLDAGQVFVNEWYAGGIETPFGGNKLSGFGREKGVEAIQSYIRSKNIAIRI